ncbi:uncharacterized protein [Fopius arisanus]|uniref:ARHGAP15 protein n=1 Tax=Fopius arisanus TaxID=64838 RepID=A0A0C9REZ5_9HYME|nr:PREDICTED: uncharacterized protein LOC105268500 [Fopius arisanus]XP_011306424.1 PREDICTED: uncharacterized protein LOC105268500 [Fopius arisanus]
MSGQDLQEHSYVKVLYDFQYKTAEGREISIKKNERLYLLQKTNADWWQVVRTWEQRSFYVPATYVREISKITRKNSDEDRDGSFEPPDHPKYKSMPKESHSSAMKNVKKWLVSAMDTKQESSKQSFIDDSYKHNAMDYQSRAELKVGLAAIKSKSLERDRKYGQSFDETSRESTRERKKSKEALKKLPEESESPKPLTKSFSTSPKSFDIPSRMEMSLQDPFRKELKSSLDRRRKISDNTDYDKLINQNRDEARNRRIRTRSSRSDDSQIDSDFDDKFDRKRFEKPQNTEDPIVKNRNSRSLELEAHQFQRTERSLSPKPTYGRQLTIAGQIPSDNDEDDHRILNDKRRTWAVEELMSELTQMCKERGSNKKPNIHLKSTEIKTFDPHDKLTQELHEMNLLKSEGHTPTTPADFKSSSPINICKISINSEDSSIEHKMPTAPLEDDETSNISETSDTSHISTENSQSKPSKLRKKSSKSAFTFKKTDTIISSKPSRSPKSPKILDEYNEANILNDISPDELLDDARSLSRDKPLSSHHPEPIHSSPDIEKPCYSNIKPQNPEKVRMRPKLKIKPVDSSSELKLTPSLEKLASEIKFQPAKRSSELGDTKMSESLSDEGHYDDSGIQEGVDKSDDSWSRLDPPEPKNYAKFRHKLEYTGSFKTKREGKYFRRREEDSDVDDDEEESWKRGLKKSSTMHCATIPDAYRRFRRDRDFNSLASISFKRRSRSLSDLKCLEEDEDGPPEVFSPKKEMVCKPVPLPRTKLPAKLDKMEGKVMPVPRRIQKREDVFSEDDVWVPRTDGYRNAKIAPGDINIESSTAVGFKTLLCTSDSGSDNYLQSKELLSSNDGLNDTREGRGNRKISAERKDKAQGRTRESLSDELVLSSNASSEALQSQSESEVTAAFEGSSQPSPVHRGGEDGYECTIDLPPGWTQKFDDITEQICFVNEAGDRWFSSNDAEGKIYFFEENSNESSWVLPTISPGKSHPKTSFQSEEKIDRNSVSMNDVSLTKNTSSTSLPASQSLANRDLPSKKSGTSLSDWPQLFDGNMRVLKEGAISRTKITENGKKLRKNWSTSYAVLTELFLLFFKDAKTFATVMKSGQSSVVAKPDISVDLNGALIEPGERASSRKNVYMISTFLGLQVLIQSDNTALAAEWFQEIHGVIRKLPSSSKSQAKPFTGAAPEMRKISTNKSPGDSKGSEESKRSSKIARSRSMKMKGLDDSLEDLSGTVAERQTKIKAKLRRFFLRRPTVESLVKNGIYKDEPAFGSYLADVCPPDHPRVPLFVKTCIEVLESNEDNMKTDGLYRASGNLSQIQKIRLQVDQYNLSVLSQEEDVHVLTGALKLFFRELKEPLIPSSFFKEALNASMLKKTSAKIQCFREIVKALPPPNYDTLQFLLKHLLKVTSYQEYNRMHIPNLAIVFGPTLMWPAEESANMALDLMQQNLVIECLLSEYNKIFK